MTFIKSKIHYSLLMITISSMLILGCKKKPVDEPAPVGPCETTYEVLYGESVSTNEIASARYEKDKSNL